MGCPWLDHEPQSVASGKATAAPATAAGSGARARALRRRRSAVRAPPHHHGAFQAALVLRHRPELYFCLQGQSSRRSPSGPRAGRALRPRGQRAQVGRSIAHHQSIDRCLERLACLGGALRQSSERNFRSPGRDHRERRELDRITGIRRRTSAHPDQARTASTPGGA